MANNNVLMQGLIDGCCGSASPPRTGLGALLLAISYYVHVYLNWV